MTASGVIKAIVCDIEGTTTSISFVKDILFPYALEHVESFLKSNWDAETVQNAVHLLRKQSQTDLEDQQLTGVVHIADENQTKERQIETVVENVKWQMSIDRKATALKLLQGLIWEQGYNAGELKGHVYPDVPKAFDLWLEQDVKIYIYSSGSVQAQKLIFGHTDYGDLRTKLSGYFDTEIGPKQDPKSYLKIIDNISLAANEILFLTDIINEAKAAMESGIVVHILERPGNAPLTEDDRAEFKTVATFDGILPIQVDSSVKRKIDDVSSTEDRPAKCIKTHGKNDDFKTNDTNRMVNDETEINVDDDSKTKSARQTISKPEKSDSDNFNASNASTKTTKDDLKMDVDENDDDNDNVTLAAKNITNSLNEKTDAIKDGNAVDDSIKNDVKTVDNLVSIRIENDSVSMNQMNVDVAANDNGNSSEKEKVISVDYTANGASDQTTIQPIHENVECISNGDVQMENSITKLTKTVDSDDVISTTDKKVDEDLKNGFTVTDDTHNIPVEDGNTASAKTNITNDKEITFYTDKCELKHTNGSDNRAAAESNSPNETTVNDETIDQKKIELNDIANIVIDDETKDKMEIDSTASVDNAENSMKSVNGEKNNSDNKIESKKVEDVSSGEIVNQELDVLNAEQMDMDKEVSDKIITNGSTDNTTESNESAIKTSESSISNTETESPNDDVKLNQVQYINELKQNAKIEDMKMKIADGENAEGATHKIVSDDTDISSGALLSTLSDKIVEKCEISETAKMSPPGKGTEKKTRVEIIIKKTDTEPGLKTETTTQIVKEISILVHGNGNGNTNSLDATKQTANGVGNNNDAIENVVVEQKDMLIVSAEPATPVAANLPETDIENGLKPEKVNGKNHNNKNGNDSTKENDTLDSLALSVTAAAETTEATTTTATKTNGKDENKEKDLNIDVVTVKKSAALSPSAAAVASAAAALDSTTAPSTTVIAVIEAES